MRDRPLILVVDDIEENIEIVRVRLEAQGYEIETASNGREALEKADRLRPDLILLDIMMPEMDGIEVTQQLKGNEALRATPIILLTAKSSIKDVVAGLDAGGDDYLTKPFEPATLVARVRSLLRIKTLYDTVQAQASELAALNQHLEERVEQQVQELERLRDLRRFLPPQIADMIASKGGQAEILQHHRREIVVLFCDLRGFTSFAEIAAPEEVMDLLNAYHSTLGPLIHEAAGTLERFTGDGMMIFFNDPIPCPDPAARAVKLAIAMRDHIQMLAHDWRLRGYSIGFGIGISQGYATMGRIGFEGRFDYAAIGTVTNVAARLCSEARDSQILVTQRIAAEVENLAALTSLGDFNLKGLSRPIQIYNIEGLRPESASA
ncbi:adenylate/guanylate cyclase domain-containing response regulator [Microvirga sp. KLBC 81]|uniref:adenylate/guanylate cyclase domain-containing protein n=1 Tax=Microvirga sp. KLBC 81 TaxID=1862707 RepID=UPI000D521BB9|nr:response regulator [Microvirga sp. KLBC 81]PVE22888.1 adenylate/guanylate cyclase domain-containing response regulator [Microvirga sp. KLBC 81]